jgi:hypothetical protein
LARSDFTGAKSEIQPRAILLSADRFALNNMYSLI